MTAFSLVVVAAGLVAFGVFSPGDPMSRVREALVEEYGMIRVPLGEGSSEGGGWRETGYLSSQSPAATVEEVKATVTDACGDCILVQYFEDSFMIYHEKYLEQTSDSGEGTSYSRFIVVTWEGPLDSDPDGGLAMVEVQHTEWDDGIWASLLRRLGLL